MSKINRAFAFLFLVLFVANIATPVVLNQSPHLSKSLDRSFEPASTNYIVDITVRNDGMAFNDDDFDFRVRNGTVALNNAWVRLYNVTTGLFTGYEDQTDGNGLAHFSNLPQGVYRWNVSHPLDTVTPQKTGQITSDGPEANVQILFGNNDWENDDDDLNATIRDIEGRLAYNLNFSIHYALNDTIWAQSAVIDGRADFEDLPEGSYNWKLSVLGDPIYDGYLLQSGSVESNGTQYLVYWNIGSLTGDPGYLDLEIFTYYETSYSPIVGADIEVTFKNGTIHGSKVTPANGTVIFVDLPAEYINWTVTYLGQPIGLGNYSYDLSSAGSDYRDPIVIGPGNLDVLLGTENVTLTWIVEDEHPSSIQIWIDDVLNVTTPWVNRTYDYVYNVSAYFPEFIIGYYEVKLVAIDMNSNFATNISILRFYENVTPVIEGPDPVEFTFGEKGHSLTWNITDEYPDKYVIQKNDDQFADGTIDPEEPVISISLDGLEVGVHNFTLYANDTSGNFATYSVLVTVLGDEVPPVIMYTPPDVYYAQGDRNKVYNWTATDDFMDYYIILVDNVIVVTDDWTTTNIAFDFAGLLQGQHNVTLKVYDLSSNMAESTVMVFVSASVASVYLTWAILITAGVIALVAIIWFVRYR